MKICLITGSRAEYGLLRQLIYKIKKERKLNLKIIVTGTHLSKKHHYTFKEIKKDGFHIDKKVNIKIGKNNTENIIKSINRGTLGFISAFKNFLPDVIILLGDRYEIFAAAISAHFSRIPIIHIHGGETTESAVDEALRHAISKMSHYHFVAHAKYKQRLIQLGEDKNKIFVVGGMGVDNIKNTKLFSKKELERKYHFKFNKKNLIINFHPETLNKFSAKKQFSELLSAIKTLRDTSLFFTMPNSDLDSDFILKMTKGFVKKQSNAFAFTSLGSQGFFSFLKYVDAMVGNSSSGLLEMPSFKKGTVNIGNRQSGRLKAKSVIDAKANKKNILKSIKILYSSSFKRKIRTVKNPYGNGGASRKILSVLVKLKLNNILIKKFHDI